MIGGDLKYEDHGSILKSLEPRKLKAGLLEAYFKGVWASTQVLEIDQELKRKIDAIFPKIFT